MLFFRFMANLKQSRRRIPDEWSVELTLTFYLTKNENRTKHFWHTSHTTALSKGTVFAKKCWLFAKGMPTSAKLMGVLVLRSIFFWKCISQISSIILTSFRKGSKFTPRKNEPRIRVQLTLHLKKRISLTVFTQKPRNIWSHRRLSHAFFFISNIKMTVSQKKYSRHVNDDGDDVQNKLNFWSG